MKTKPQTTKPLTTKPLMITRAAKGVKATRGTKAQKGAKAAKGAKMQPTKGTLSVTGEGEVKVRPDIALIDLDVVTSAKSAQQAVQQNAERMNRVIEALKDMGVRPADLQTIGYDVIPVIDREEKSATFGQILEYRVVAQLRVRAAVEDVGEMIDTSVRSGANLISGVRYSVRDEAGLRARALKAAVRSARHDADAVADSLGIKLVNPERIEINMGGTPVFFRDVAMGRSALSTPIEPGNIEIRATVQIMYCYTQRR